MAVASFVLATSLFGGTVMAEEQKEIVKGDITGDGYIGTEDVIYSVVSASSYAMPDVTYYPPVVKFNTDPRAWDIDGDGRMGWDDSSDIVRAIIGAVDWGVGNRKMTASDKAKVVYRHDGEYVTAYVKIKKMLDTAIIYDKTKVEYVGMTLEGIGDYGMLIADHDNKELGFVDVAGGCPFVFDYPEERNYGTIELKFRKLNNSEDITFASWTGAGYIQDNLKEGESFIEAAQQYADAVYKKGYIINDKVTLEEAQRALKIALNIMPIPSDESWNADINDDSKVTLEDARKYLRLALNIDEI